MKNFVLKLLTLGVIASILMTAFTACSMGKRKRDVISSDTPWFNNSKVVVGTDYDRDVFDYQVSNLAGATDDVVVYHATGSYVLPDDFNWDTDSYADYMYDTIIAYDYEGNMVGSADIMEAYNAAGFGDRGSITGVVKVGDIFVVNAVRFSDDYTTKTNYQATFDLTTYEVSAFEEVDLSGAEAEYVQRDNANYEKTMYVGDYTIRTYFISGDFETNSPSSYVLVAYDANNNSTAVDMREQFPNDDVFNIYDIIDIGNGRGLICSDSNANADGLYYILDTNTMSLTAYTDDISWLSDSIRNVKYVDGYGSVVVNQEGISSIDFDNRQLVSILNFNNTNVNRFDVNNTTPIRITDDRIILEGVDYTPSVVYRDSRPALYIFDRAESNPNAGKSILTVASLGSFNYPMCETMCRFNETNPDYFIQIDTRYVLAKFYDPNYSDDPSVSDENAQLALGNQLSIDLMDGEGPDIIIDGASYSQLNNPDYLLDLSDYVAGLDSSNYFTNIIDAASTDGHIYQLPVTYFVQGIVTNASNVTPGQIGFTYDEYAQFVETVCNGQDPMGADNQTNFFIAALALMPDLMQEDGRVNYNNDAFVALAEYTRDHVNNRIDGDSDDEHGGGFGYGDNPASMQTINDMRNYITSVVDSSTEKVLVGLPTYDGRGPAVGCFNSVGVVANLSSQESAACLDFVSMLIDNNTQYQLGIVAGIPINRNAFEEVGRDYVDQHNADTANYRRDWTPEEYRNNNVSPDPIDYSKIDEFANIISSACSWVTSDPAINAIVREEIPAYFEGHKTLDQIIEVMQNRVQTLISERG
ncbi:MAG: extracellular solute-binding protein [Saccharofermentans sp.]|nr:extracellular solute-binding protein [Saccharofermentans sp.]